jgi:hypothetical protein
MPAIDGARRRPGVAVLPREGLTSPVDIGRFGDTPLIPAMNANAVTAIDLGLGQGAGTPAR